MSVCVCVCVCVCVRVDDVGVCVFSLPLSRARALVCAFFGQIFTVGRENARADEPASERNSAHTNVEDILICCHCVCCCHSVNDRETERIYVCLI